MIPLTPALLVAAANAFVGLGEEGGDNRGQMVELFLKEVNQPAGQPWCAAFVHHAGYWSHYDNLIEKSSWPLPATAGCQELGEFAKEDKILLKEPRLGDVFLLFSIHKQRFGHTGVVLSLERSLPTAGEDWLYQCKTIEGNTNDDGSDEGRTTLRKVRWFNTFVGDRFIRWADLDQRLKAAA